MAVYLYQINSNLIILIPGATVGGCACGRKFSDKPEHAHLYINGTATPTSESDVKLKQIDPSELLRHFNKSGEEIKKIRKEKEQARVEGAVSECKRQKGMSELECEVAHN